MLLENTSGDSTGQNSRKVLEQQNPTLIAARDAAIAQQKRDRIQGEFEGKQIHMARSAHR
jgi:hypothetical protein